MVYAPNEPRSAFPRIYRSDPGIVDRLRHLHLRSSHWLQVRPHQLGSRHPQRHGRVIYLRRHLDKRDKYNDCE